MFRAVVLGLAPDSGAAIAEVVLADRSIIVAFCDPGSAMNSMDPENYQSSL